jgi:hypothetical protein
VVWSPDPPYEILSNALIPFEAMQRMKRFARTWDLLANRGNFVQSAPLLWRGRSPFAAVLAFSELLSTRVSLGNVSLFRLAEVFLEHLVTEARVSREEAAPRIAQDLARGGRRVPSMFKEYLRVEGSMAGARGQSVPERQRRHLRA